MTEFLNRGCNFIFFSVCFFHHNMKLEPYGIHFYFPRIEDSIRELTCFYAFVTVESIAAEVRVSREGPGVSWLSRTATHLETESGAMWKWINSSGWRTDPHMFVPGWSSLKTSCVYYRLFETFLSVFSIWSQRTSKKNDIFFGKINLKFSAGAHINHYLRGCLERPLSLAKGPGTPLIPSPSYIWIGLLYLTKEVDCHVCLHSAPGTLNCLWFLWPRTTKACKFCLPALGIDKTKVTYSFSPMGQLMFLLFNEPKQPS